MRHDSEGQAATDRYRALLDEAGPAATAAHLSAEIETRRLHYGGAPICATVQPGFVGAGEADAFRTACHRAMRLIERADTLFRTDRALRDRWLGAHPLRPLIEAHRGGLPEATGRFDAMRGAGGGLRFIEYNAGLCGGLYSDEALADAFDLLAPMQALAAERPIAFERTGRAFVEALVALHAERGRGPLARVAFVIPDGPAGDMWPDHGEVRMMRAELAAQGIEGRVLRIGACDLSTGAIAADGWVADAACIFDWIALMAEPPAAPLLAGPPLPGTWLVNTLGAAIFRGGKHVFAMLSDPAIGIAADPAERAWIDRHIPWTRMVVPGDTRGPDGRVAPLHDHLRRHRADLVLKPCFAMGGRGVVLGWQANEAAWEAAIAAAAAEPSVVQQRVAAPHEDYACVTADGTVADRRLQSDLCCYYWHDGRAHGLHRRVSASGLMNISGAAGGTVVPVYVAG